MDQNLIFESMLKSGERLIGRYTGTYRGPLLICLGGTHGNEWAGVRALELLFKMIEVEPITNPEFEFHGRIVGFRGNVAALKTGCRFVELDLNRIWLPHKIEEVMGKPIHKLHHEDRELHELIVACNAEIEDYNPSEIVVLDLHTTSCEGGIFSIVSEDMNSIELGIELHAPVVRGMDKGLSGTTLQYFKSDNFDRPITCVSFESGQHDNPLSVNRAIAAIINCMRTIGSVDPEHVENQHDKLLIEHSKDLPKVVQLIYSHKIIPGDHFKMVDGFKNFDFVFKGDILAHDRNGPIRVLHDGLLLMPLYQSQGHDGFFIVEQHDPGTLPPRKPVSQRVRLRTM